MVIVAVAVPSAPPSVALIWLVIFTCSPAPTPVTFTVMVQFVRAARVPAVSEMEPLPATAVIAPVQVVTKPLGVAILRPSGRLSTKFMPERPVTAFGLPIVKMSVVTPFNGSTATPNALLMVGGSATMVVAVVVLPLPPSNELITDVTLVLIPADVPVIETTIVQEPAG